MKLTEKLFTKNINIVLIFLLLHLTIVYTKAIYFLNPDKVEVWYDLPLAFFVALGYSFITIINIRQGKNRTNNIVFAILDGVGVFLYYNGTQTESLYTGLVSIFFAFLTGYGVYSVGHIALNKHEESVEKTDNNLRTEELEKELEKVKALNTKLQSSLLRLEKSVAKEKEELDTYKKGYYLYMKGRLKIYKDEDKKQLAEFFEEKAQEIKIDIFEQLKF